MPPTTQRPGSPGDGAFLDHAAGSPTLPEVIDLVAELSRASHANPTGAHRAAREARRLLEEAREVVAGSVGCRPSEVIWCSGGTEADNLAVVGLGRDGVAAVSAIEHPAVAEPAARRGAVTVPVGHDGRVDPGALGDLVGVGLVSVMAVNNEVGTIQPLAEVAAVIRDLAPGAVVHTDAVQAASWLDLRSLWPHVDALSLSAHKFGGPKGVGVLVVRDGTALAPQQLGGGQERDRRSGTQNVVGAAAMALALSLTDERRAATVARVAVLRDRLVDGLAAAIDGLFETGVSAGDRSHKIAGSAHVCLPGVESEALLFLLDEAGVAASAASSCASGAQQASGVLGAMGVAPGLAAGSLRLSLGATTTTDEIDLVLEVLPAAVARLRETGS